MITGLRFQLPNKRFLFIRKEAIEKMVNHRQLKRKDKEAGGIMIGRILVENENFIIDDVSEPKFDDIRKRHRFIRSPKGHQEYFNMVWENNDGHCFYLGEWHTHPELIPTPSSVDNSDWNQNLKRDHESDALFFIIVGTKEIKVWHGCRKTGEITSLKGDHL